MPRKEAECLCSQRKPCVLHPKERFAPTDTDRVVLIDPMAEYDAEPTLPIIRIDRDNTKDK